MENLNTLRKVVWLTAAVAAGALLLLLVAIPLLTWRIVAALGIVGVAVAYAVRIALVLIAELEKRDRDGGRE